MVLGFPGAGVLGVWGQNIDHGAAANQGVQVLGDPGVIVAGKVALGKHRHSESPVGTSQERQKRDLPTLNQLWSRGQQVILSYEEESVVSRHGELWPGIPYWWGDQVKAQELIQYLERMKSCGRPGGLFVAGINLTENLAYVLGHPSQSLRKMTLPNLPCLSTWVREQCPGPGAQCTNIIAGDFIGADTFVGDVIRLNEKLLRCSRVPFAAHVECGREEWGGIGVERSEPGEGVWGDVCAPGPAPATGPTGPVPRDFTPAPATEPARTGLGDLTPPVH
ncbi:hypothetical protein GH733_016276 [Mirounga leonina]|nr:hypothetical protein GH733_016276 [Mirounga leonina]